jgi:hypothetical protein
MNITSRNGTVAKSEQMPSNDDSERESNAHLIAAAPDLLSAARNAANVLAALATGQLAAIKTDSNALKELRAAIAKAEGVA